MILNLIQTAYAASRADCSKPTGLFELDRGIPGGFGDLNHCGAQGSLDLDVIIRIISNLISIALTLAGVVAVIMLIVGGITYIISRSRPDLMESAFNTIKYAIVGLVVIMISYSIVFTVNTFALKGLG